MYLHREIDTGTGAHLPEPGLAANAVGPDSGPVARDGLRITRLDPVSRDVVADILRALEEVSRAVVPHDCFVDARREFVRHPGPVPSDCSRESGIDVVMGDVVAHVLRTLEEVGLAVGPDHHRID